MVFFLGVNEWLTSQAGSLAPLYLAGLLGVVLIALSLPLLLSRRQDPFDKLQASDKRSKQRFDNRKKTSLRHGSRFGRLDKFANYLEPQNAEEMSSERLRLLQAGYRSKSAVRTLHAIQFALSIAFLILGILYCIITFTTGEMTLQQLAISTLIPAAIGYFLPQYWIRHRVGSRREEIIKGFPDSLDMLLVCVEAGQSLEMSILRVSKEMKVGYPALADEFETVSNELKAGKERVQVLKDFSERAGVPDVSSFVTVMIQSASFGTSIAGALRVYAAEMRDKRVMRAEEKANVLPTKLTLGTMLFTVPPLIIILVGPAIYQMIQTFNPG